MRVGRDWWVRPLAIVWLGVIGWSTLRSAPTQAAEVAALHWYCVVCGQSGIADLFLNVLLFIPLGVAARAAGWPLARSFLAALVLTVSIEVIQGTVLVGRDASLGDVLANSAGNVVGWSGFPLLLALRRPGDRLAWRGAWTVLLLSAAVWFATATALEPDLSPVGPWSAQVTHVWPGHARFPGDVLRVQLDGLVVPEGSLEGAPGERAGIALGIEIVRRGAQMPSRQMSLLRVVDRDGIPQVNVTAYADDVVAEFALRGTAWGLHSPEWLFSDALRIPVDQPWRLHWTWRRHRFELIRGGEGLPTRTTTVVPLSIALGWSFIHPYVAVVGRTEPLWTALWLIWWFGIFGWLAGWCTPTARWGFGVVGVMTFVAAGLATGLPPSPVQVVVAVLAFLLLSAAAQRSRHRHYFAA